MKSGEKKVVYKRDNYFTSVVTSVVTTVYIQTRKTIAAKTTYT